MLKIGEHGPLDSPGYAYVGYGLAGVPVRRNALLAIYRAGPSRCGAQCKTWARGPMQDLSVGPF